MIVIDKLPEDYFDWQRWRAGIAVWREIGVACRRNSIIENSELLLKFAVGYIHGSLLRCRPKNNEYAVMFLIDDNFCWTHFREEEFLNVFNR